MMTVSYVVSAQSQITCTIFHIAYLHEVQVAISWLFTASAVEVNFNEDSYTVLESDGQASISLRIDGKFFFIPVWAVVKTSDGAATGGLCKYKLIL